MGLMRPQLRICQPALQPPGKAADQPTFSLLHSNILYIFFFLGASIILALDSAIAYFRNGGNISKYTKYTIAVFIINIILWMSFNYSRTVRRGMLRQLGDKLRWAGVLAQVTLARQLEERQGGSSWELMGEDLLINMILTPCVCFLHFGRSTSQHNTTGFNPQTKILVLYCDCCCA